MRSSAAFFITLGIRDSFSALNVASSANDRLLPSSTAWDYRVWPAGQGGVRCPGDPIVRRMAEQDVLVMGRAAKPYLDQVRATARPKLQQAIDRIWQRILDEGR